MTNQLLNKPANPKTSSGLPDVNVETYPFDVVQSLLDRAAFLNMFAVPDASHGKQANTFIPDDWYRINGGYGLEIASVLHRFESTFDKSLVLKQSLGEKVGYLRMHLLFGSEATDWSPGQEPMPRLFDPWRPQRFVTTELTLGIGDDAHGHGGYAIGRTYVVTIDGRPQVVLCAVGNLFQGIGDLSGLVGTFCMQGSLTRDLGFQGNVSCRIVDPGERLSSSRPGSIPPLVSISSDVEQAIFRDDAASYIALRVEKENRSIRSEYGPSTHPGNITLLTPAVMKAVKFGLQAQPRAKLECDMQVGKKFAKLEAAVVLNILAPPGTPDSPNDFETTNTYAFADETGREVGTITGFIQTGKSFDLKFPEAPGQLGMRFGGFGPLLRGTGVFEGVQGTLFDNSAIGVAPHAVSGLHVIRLVDPTGRYRGLNFKSTHRRPNSRLTYCLHKETEKKTEPHPGHNSLPDLNSGTHPFEQVLGWLDEAAYFNMCSIPQRGKNFAITSRNQTGTVVGVHIQEALHRFDIGMQLPDMCHGVTANNRIGEIVGGISHRWMFIPDQFHALPGRNTIETAFDPTRSQRFVMIDGACRFNAGQDGFMGFGTGRTYPTQQGNSSTVLVGAVGNITAGFGRFANCVGTYTYCGLLSPEHGFRGNLMCRVMDPSNVFSRSILGLPAITQSQQAEAGVTYIVFRGQKPNSASETTYSFDDKGDVNGLNVKQELRLFSLDFSTKGGFSNIANVGPVIGNMTSHVMFNILNPGAPGSASSPIPFQSFNRFEFTDANCRTLGSFEVDGGEGRTFNMTLTKAPDQQALRFGVFGPIVRGTGVFEGKQGMMTDNSVVAISPHAVATLYTLRIDNLEQGRFASFVTKSKNTPLQIAESPFGKLIDNLNHNKHKYVEWRRDFRKCGEAISVYLSNFFNNRTNIGDFRGLEIDGSKLKSTLEAPIKPFDAKTFDRYGGCASGTFRTYDTATGAEVTNPTILYSVWDKQTRKLNDRYVKAITGSYARFFAADALPDPNQNNVDLLVNSYHSDTGVTSWISIFQNERRERTSFGYKLPHEDEVLWFVKDVSKNGEPIEDDVFMASHEWKGIDNGQTKYFMVGCFFSLEPNNCRIKPFGNQFWRALYVEE